MQSASGEVLAAGGPAKAQSGARELTQSQIAEQVGISQMHVSRLLAKTLTQLRSDLLED